MVGGCLPMLVQMPLFIAYFEVLSNVIELRQAHWFWLTDLSLPDPSHALPILIIISMFLTQFITPSPGMDPAQRRMMAFMMPVFFGFILWHYASGLALYWGTSNLINLAIQLASINPKDGQGDARHRRQKSREKRQWPTAYDPRPPLGNMGPETTRGRAKACPLSFS
jgi:YidC/Oxa1 family membrane protein insertase